MACMCVDISQKAEGKGKKKNNNVYTKYNIKRDLRLSLEGVLEDEN